MGYKTYTCPHARNCGGCEWLSVPYPIQLKRKREALVELYKPFDIEIPEVIGMEDALHYRNKVMTPFVRGKRGNIEYGMYKRGTHELVRCDDCLVEAPQARPIIASIARLAKKFKIEPYDEDSGRGLLRHAVIRIAATTGEIMVTLVINRREFPHKNAFVRALRDEHPEVSTVVFNVNTRRTNAVMGPNDSTAFGQGWIVDELCGATFRIPSRSFFQTNPQQTQVLYNLAIDLAQAEPQDRILDAYCGIGTIGIIAAGRCGASLIGVESVAQAVEAARENARLNSIDDSLFVTGDAGEYLLAADDACDVVFMDPPRSGATPEFIDALLQAAPRRIVYVSCDPKTQVRDIELLKSAYRLERLVGVDMFPHTKHVETVALLTRA